MRGLARGVLSIYAQPKRAKPKARERTKMKKTPVKKGTKVGLAKPLATNPIAPLKTPIL
jgi:hypothetical protein